MEKSIITFLANEQNLQKTGGIGCYASDTVSYIEAHFALGENWSGYDSIRAVWFNDYKTISTVLDFNGVCIVPHEVLVNRGKVMVNLVGSVLVSDELKDRLTTFPCEALKVSAKAKISGSETAAVTPSQFEQFVSIVISEVEKVTGMTAQAETLPAGSQATARYENGILYLGIPQGIRGERGETGADGADGNGIASVVYNADYSLTLIFDNGERFTTPPIRGERGPAGADGRDGADGADGVTPNLSIGNVTTLEPSEDAYVTRRGTDENPIFDFGIPKGDTGTVPDLDLILPTDTASGDIVSIPDGQSVVPVKSLKVSLEPIQDLHGYDKPWSGGAGKNKFPTAEWFTEFNAGANNLLVADTSVFLPAGTYTLSFDYYTEGISSNQSFWRIYSEKVTYCDTSKQIGYGGFGLLMPTSWTNKTVTFTTAQDGWFGIDNGQLRGGVHYKNIQLESGNTATSWTPYSNICPISGHTEVDTEVCGKNLVNIANVTGDKTVDVRGLNITYTCFMSLKTSDDFSASSNVWEAKAVLKDGTAKYAFPTFVSGTGLINATKENPLVSIECRYTNITRGSYDVQLEVGSAMTEFEPYIEPTTYTTTLGQTVYGGTLDVVSGELVVDRAMIVLDGTQAIQITNWRASENGVGWLYPYSVTNNAFLTSATAIANIVSDKLQSQSYNNLYGQNVGIGLYNGTAYGIALWQGDTSITTKEAINAYLAQNPITVVYELATPQTYQLDPQTISLLHGNNNVWSDGSVEVTYNADVGLYIDKKLGTSGTRTLSMTRTLAKSEDTDDAKSDNIQLAED